MKRPRLSPSVVGLAVAAVALLSAGCNIFSVFNLSLGNYRSLVERAEAAYEAGDYRTAVDRYAEAIRVNPRGSKARVGYVNAYARLRMVDFLWLAQEFSRTNVSMADLLNRPQVRNNILGPQGLFPQTIEKLEPVVEGQCDNEVPSYDIAVNLQIGLAYLVRGLVRLSDSDGDGFYSTTNDFLVLGADGTPRVNDAAFRRIDDLIALASTPSNGIGAVTGFGAVFSAVTNMSALTNLEGGTNGTFRYYLQAWHDTAEALLDLLKNVDLNIRDLRNAYRALHRVVSPYSGEPLLRNVWGTLQRLNSELDEVVASLNTPATMLNDLHNDIVGTPAYTGAVSSFRPSPFSDHMADPVPGTPVHTMVNTPGRLGPNGVSSLTNLYNNTALSNLLRLLP